MDQQLSLDDYEIADITEQVATGRVLEVLEPETMNTRFGTRTVVTLRVQVGNKVFNLPMFLNPSSRFIHPRSTAYKLMKTLGVRKLRELVGKEIPLRMDQSGFWRFNV